MIHRVNASRASGREILAAHRAAASQGVSGSNEDLLDGALLEKLEQHIESTAGSYTAK